MTDRNEQRGNEQRGDEESGRTGREGFGDDGGTRVGRPDPARGADAGQGPSSRPVKEGLEGAVFEGQPTGAGAEAVEGTHGAMQDRSPSENTSVDAASVQNADKDNARRGSEPLTGRDREHVSGYGGQGGEPRTSSDQRE